MDAQRQEGYALAGFVRAARERLGMTVTGLADRSGLTKSEISGIESGRIKLPGADKRRRLADALAVRHVDVLMAAGEISAEELPGSGARSAPVDRLDAELRGLTAAERADLAPVVVSYKRAIAAAVERGATPEPGAGERPAGGVW